MFCRPLRVTSTTVAVTSSAVWIVVTTSTSFMIGAGLKKCIPITSLRARCHRCHFHHRQRRRRGGEHRAVFADAVEVREQGEFDMSRSRRLPRRRDRRRRGLPLGRAGDPASTSSSLLGEPALAHCRSSDFVTPARTRRPSPPSAPRTRRRNRSWRTPRRCRWPWCRSRRPRPWRSPESRWIRPLRPPESPRRRPRPRIRVPQV